MGDEKYLKGAFTLPGEAGYEKLTLKLAEKWGADVIRDSDGTKLSSEIVDAGYRIYSTICIIREHNAFALEHPETQQQTFLISERVLAQSSHVEIHLLEGYFQEQFELNTTPDSIRYWQVYDRTTETEVPREQWKYADGTVTVEGATPWHTYTVSFLCWRIWEEINMYNHTTNHWTTEHLRQLDPRHPLAWAFLKDWLEKWCIENPQTNVIRLTSLFYNFVWIFGADMRRRNWFTDWASYDFTVSPAALDAFREEYGYALTAEDFINQGKLQVTHMPPSSAKRDYMDFIQRFVAQKAKELVEIIHRHGKQAYVFYDDSWVGMEPYGKYFASVGFDGLIKCVFSGYECRMCAGADVPVHELRFHPYLFPVGLGGLPTFMEGGHPEKDAMDYWHHVRRALMRQCVDRIGLGGYLHLTEGFLEFVDCIQQMGIEFRKLKELHSHGAPSVMPCRVAVLHSWGSLRSWTLSGHFHETYMHPLIHINEALSGLPVDVKFVSFDEVREKGIEDADVVINAGHMGDSWSGGNAWKDDALVAQLARFVYQGGVFLGVGDPSAVDGYATLFRMADVLGIDKDLGARVCHGKWAFEETGIDGVQVIREALGHEKNLYLTDGKATVLASEDGIPQMTVHSYGQGYGVYLSDFKVSAMSTRMLLEILMMGTKEAKECYLSDNPYVDVAYFPNDGKLVAASVASESVETNIATPNGNIKIQLEPHEMIIQSL